MAAADKTPPSTQKPRTRYVSLVVGDVTVRRNGQEYHSGDTVLVEEHEVPRLLEDGACRRLGEPAEGDE